MPLPIPEAGLVISYSYLWKRQSRRGREEGEKGRPCVVALIVERSDSDKAVWVVPITHVNPNDEEISIEIPANVKAHLKLDNDRSWIILDEVNIFNWPGPDLRPLPGRKGVFDYGHLPPKLYNQVRDKMVALHNKRNLASVKRTE